MRERSKGFWVIFVILILLVILHVHHLFFSATPLWGLAHMGFLSPWVTFAFIILSLVCLEISAFGPSPESGRSILRIVSVGLFDSPHAGYRRLGVVLVFTSIFIIFRMPTHFLGDGYSLLYILGNPHLSLVKWSEQGAFHAVRVFQEIWGGPSRDAVLDAFQFISVFSGAVTFWLFFRIADGLAEDPVKKLWVFINLALSGSILMFFGYVESYPLLWVAVSGFVGFGIGYLTAGQGLIYCLLFALLGVFIHVQMIIFIPALLFLLLHRGPLRRIYDKYKRVVWSLLAVMGMAVAGAFVYMYRSDLYFEDMFLPLWEGKPISPGYTIFSLHHLLDVFNELMLLAPLLPVLIYAAIPLRRAMGGKPVSIFLLLMSAASLGFLVVIDPKLSMPRDWDLFALSAFPLVLFLIYNASEEKMAAVRKLFPAAAVVLAFSTAAYLGVNLKTDLSVEYTKHIIDYDPAKSLGSLRSLKLEHYIPRQEYMKADSIARVINNRFPEEGLLREADLAIDKGDFDRTRQLLGQIKPDRFSVNYHNLKGLLHLFDKQYDSALVEIQKSLNLGRYYGRTWLYAGLIYMRRGEKDRALDAFRIGYELEPDNDYILEELGVLYLERRALDSALIYLKKSILANPDNVRAYYFVGEVLAAMGDIPNLIECTNYYRRHGESDPRYKPRLEKLEMYLESVPDSLKAAKIRRP